MPCGHARCACLPAHQQPAGREPASRKRHVVSYPICIFAISQLRASWQKSPFLAVYREGSLRTGLAVGALGLAWLGPATVGLPYWTAVAVPMLLIGVVQDFVPAPLTTAAVADVRSDDAGAASGMVNVAHQLGGLLGLAVLVVVFAAVGPAGAVGAAALAQRVSAAIDTAH